MKRPEKTEYAAYYETYVSLVEETDIVTSMRNQADELREIFSQISDEQGLYRYATGKWSIKELLGHLIDGERVFAYRALRFARADKQPLAGFDQDPYIENANFDAVNLQDLLEEMLSLRNANTLFFNNLSEEAWSRTGVASENEISVRAIAFILVGHIRHHVKVLEEKYLN
jgi:DinB superfamily